MAGPWVSMKIDIEYAKRASWEEGDAIEIACYDDDGEPMGNAVLIIDTRIRSALFQAYVAHVGDKEYLSWLSGGGHPNPGLYRSIAGGPDDKEFVYKKLPVIAVYKWRLLCRGSELLDLGSVKWIHKRAIPGITQKIMEHQKRLLASRSAIGSKEVVNTQDDKERGTRPQLVRRSDPRHQDRTSLQDELEGLRESVERDPTGKQKPRGRSESPRRNSEKDQRRKRSREAGQKKASRPPPVTRLKPAQEVEVPRSPSRERSRSIRKRSRSGKDKKKKKRNRSESSSNSDSASVFRNASSSKGRSTQARLIAWSAKHPGRLLAQALQKMEDRVGRDGEAASWKPLDMPAAAKSYYLRVLKPENASKRNLRELATLCTAVDHIAQGRAHQAGDVLIQRLKALELAACTGNWERASYLELVESEGAPLVGKEEEFMAAKESEFQKRIHKADPAYPQDHWPSNYPNGGNVLKGLGKVAPWKGKGSGKDKGKGKGKGKGGGKKGQERINWDWQAAW